MVDSDPTLDFDADPDPTFHSDADKTYAIRIRNTMYTEQCTKTVVRQYMHDQFCQDQMRIHNTENGVILYL